VLRYGITPPPFGLHTRDAARDEPFWPRQALSDAAFALLLLAALLGMATRGAALQGPADPGGAANPRPEWYFRPLFQLLKIMPGPLESLAAFGAPLIAAVFLFALPFIDKDARARKPVLAALLGGMVAAAGLCLASYRADAKSPQFARGEAMARMRAQKALRLARTLGVPPEGALSLLMNQPDERGGRLFARACTEWRGLLEDPGAPAYYDVQNRMPDFGSRLRSDDLDDLVAFLQSLEQEELDLAQGG
jgi:ubiquinol-cytochrome c reductase cytochrome b subunit